MGTPEIGDDTLDSRDIEARIAELETTLEEVTGDEAIEAADELASLDAFRAEACNATDEWRYGAIFIHERYFTEYAEELASDITSYDPRNAAWPFTHIDWDSAAEALKMDYTEVDFAGHTYYVRA
jgi:hypothetical protein